MTVQEIRIISHRYELVDRVGQGGMGAVYRVRHTSLDRMFAMKVLRRELARDEELSGRFILEAKATASVRHPHVVEITDFGSMPTGVPYFVMELLVGQSLADVIKAGGPIPHGRAVRIIKQVAGALGAAHAAGIVHRDLKPDNVLLTGGAGGAAGAAATADDVRVVDFGAAKIVGSSRVTRQGIVFGTPAYMSPEQASGQPVDHRADVYALGVIMYEMFTGRVPFEADTYMGVLTQHMFVQPVPPSRVSPSARELGALEAITLACLAKKPEDRFASMDDLVAAFDSVVRFREDGTVEVAPLGDARLSRAPPASVRFRMADELEPPTLEEMRVAIDSALPPRRVVPWAWIVGVGAALVSAVVAWTLLGKGPSAGGAPPVSPRPATATTAPPPLSIGSSQPVPPPPAVQSAPAPPPSSAAPRPPARRVTPVSTVRHGVIDDVGDPFATKH